MNGYRSVPAPRYHDDDPISPASLDSISAWGGSSTGISHNLDSMIYRSRAEHLPTDRSSDLFHRLPDEIIERILWAADANGFASLCILNRTWYQRAQNLELYAYHLSRCPSYALANNVITGPFRKNDLYRLKTKFAAEVRRNLFDAYLKPRETHINLISISANSSAAFPGGEAFRFEFSPNGQTILAISSSRIYVLDASTDTIQVKRELKTVRRPLSASITDDGSLMAVLSSKYQANIYGLTPGKPADHLQVIVLDNPPKTIALAHEGTVLAAAWTGGIEVFSLAANALSTDRRAVRSEAVDSLMFSGDGSMLIGSSHDLEEPNAVVITAPFYTENDPNITSREIHSRMWTTQILFPQISSTVSHAALLSGHLEGDAYWLFAYDHMLMTYRAVRTDDTRTGVAYFLSPPGEDRFDTPQPSIAPVATSCGTLAVAGFAEQGLTIYGIPERLDISPDMGSVVERHDERMRGRMALTSATGHMEPLMAYSPSASGASDDIEEDGLAGKVDWRQSLFVKCRPIKSIPGFASAKWVEQTEEHPCGFAGKRLVVTAPSGISRFADDLGDEDMPVDGSRICLLDFDYGPSRLENREFTIEVGENEAELLTEQMGNMEIEVAMERRRTVRATRNGTTVPSRTPIIGRSHTAASPLTPSHFDELLRRNIVSQPSSPSEDMTNTLSRNAHLARASTAAGFQTARFPPRPPLGTSQTEYSVYGRGGPHRGSVDSWETPPPPYGHDGLPVPAISHRSHASSPNLRPASVHGDASPSSTSLNSNMTLLAQLGTFQHRNQPQHNMANYSTAGPVTTAQSRFPPRANTTMDGMMTTDRAPRVMSMYGGGNRGFRHGGIPEEGSDIVQDLRPRQSPTINNNYVPSPAMSPVGSSDAYLVGRRPQSNAGIPMNGDPVLRPTVTHPVSPPTPEREAWIAPAASAPSPQLNNNRENRVSLTGANLQNRLNLPVPPVPDDEAPATYYPPMHQIPASPPMQQMQNGGSPRDQNYRMSPVTPTMEQMARLNQRGQSPTPHTPPIGYGHMPNSASRDYGGVAPSPPRAAWGASGVPGSPSFNRAIAMPNGLVRNNSRGSNRSIGASRSTPNLLQTQGSRPPYNRLDTINSTNSQHRPAEHERSRSIGNEQHFQMIAASRNHTDSSLSEKKNKRGKKRRDDGNIAGQEIKRRGLRCVVM